MRRIANAHRSYAHPLAWWFPDDGRELLFTAGHEGDGELRCWDTASGLRVVDFEADEWLLVHNGALAPLPDGRLILATSDPGGLHRWDAHTGQSLGRNESTTIWHVTTAPSASGRLLFVGAGIDGHLHRWDAATGEPEGSSWKCHSGYALTVTSLILPDGTPLVVTGGEDGTVRRWHAETGKPVGEPLTVSPDGRAFNLASCQLPDGRVLLLAHDEVQGIHRWNAATGEPIGPPLRMGKLIPHTTAVVPVAGAPRVIVASEDETVHQWNALTGEQLAPPHPGDAAAAALRPDGTAVLATGSHDGALRLDELGTD
ncbi:WD40 repeat domain-containing protein [Streptomyces sp. NPDC059849]|uniref:WD40 repeat domain-containing protein n=1 Tax=Streptomyces sp. NPDC059849 TaxID=3346969 RepID=UPI00365030DD